MVAYPTLQGLSNLLPKNKISHHLSIDSYVRYCTTSAQVSMKIVQRVYTLTHAFRQKLLRHWDGFSAVYCPECVADQIFY